MEPKHEKEVPSLKRRLQGTSNEGPAAKVTVDDEQLQEFNGDGGGLQERLFAENVLHCEISLSQQAAAERKKANKEKRKEGLNGTKVEKESIQDKIVKNACALLNSGGGILRMTISDSEALQGDIFKNRLDSFWKTLEQKLNSLVAPSTYDNVFDRLTRGSEEILLFVNAPQHLCTINYNLYFAGDAGVHGGTFVQVLDILQNSGNCPPRSSNDDLLGSLSGLLPKELSFNKEFEGHESKTMQLKCFSGPKPILENHGQRHRVQQHISAFANSVGGVILVGIDDSGIVQGVDMKISTRAYILKKVELMLKDMKFPIVPEKGVHWDLDFIKVSDCETTQDLAVPVIKVAGMKEFGGLFEKTPESYEIQNGKVQKIEFDQWKEKIKGSQLPIVTKAREQLLSKFEKLQRSSGVFPVLSVKGQVQKIRDCFFGAKEGFPVMPEGFQETLPKEVQDTIIVQIQKLASSSTEEPGLIVASKSWRASLGELPNDHVICDLLVISNGLGGLHLYTVCREGMEDKCYDYSKEVSLNIKRKLVQNGGCFVRVYITYHVVSLSTKVEAPQSDKRYPQCYDLLNQKQGLNVVLKALVIILVRVPLVLSYDRGVDFMWQFKLMLEETYGRGILLITGAAGTGKTQVAGEMGKKIALIEKLKEDQILFVGIVY